MNLFFLGRGGEGRVVASLGKPVRTRGRNYYDIIAPVLFNRKKSYIHVAESPFPAPFPTMAWAEGGSYVVNIILSRCTYLLLLRSFGISM